MDRMEEARKVMKCINNIWLFYLILDVVIVIGLAISSMEQSTKIIALLICWGIFQFSFSNWERKTERVYKKRYSIHIPESCQ